MTEGIVTAILANYYRVQVPGEGQVRLCKLRSKLKKIRVQVMVGDRVTLSEGQQTGDQGAIDSVHPRESWLVRPAIANVEQVLLVLSVASPDFEAALASKFLVQIETVGLPVVVVLNKADLGDPAPLVRTLATWGYGALPVSTATGQGISEVQTQLMERTTVLAGPSGVGKSSLMNALAPGLQLRVGEVSERQGHGRHTTRHVEIFTLAGGIRVADTPGFSNLTLALPPEALAHHFPEFRAFLGTCQFRDCTHRQEPGCAVHAAGLDRYGIYLEFLGELLTAERPHLASEAGLKRQSRPQNTAAQIPKLASTHRQPSRRQQKQILDHWEEDTEPMESL